MFTNLLQLFVEFFQIQFSLMRFLFRNDTVSQAFGRFFVWDAPISLHKLILKCHSIFVVLVDDDNNDISDNNNDSKHVCSKNLPIHIN